MGTRRPVQLWLIVAAVLVTVAAGAGIGIAATGLQNVLPATSPTGPGVPKVSGAGSGPGPATSALVRLDANAAGSSSGPDVLALLDRHFTAINRGDFDMWKTTVTAARSSNQSPDHWQAFYRSTVDSDVVVTAIRPRTNGLLIAIEFRSDQNPTDAPADLPVARICWSSQWPVDGNGRSLRIGTPAKGATEKRQC